MLPKTKTERHSDICKEINALYARKNHDYGDSFHQTFTEEGMAMPRIRLGDKLARFKSLTKSEVQEVKDESIRDTLIDLANYAIMTVLELDDLKAEEHARLLVKENIIIKRGHEAVLEHCSFTVKFICDRGVSHEIVRHRMASYCQESTRYCNYGKGKFGEEITVIEPCFWPEGSDLYWAWKNACLISEQCYFSLLKSGATPQEARSVLPNSLKTEVVMTANIREWRHFLKLRCSPAAHPQMREVALILLDKVHALIPVCFDDIWSEYHADV
mgnify:CR=1 FL=1